MRTSDECFQASERARFFTMSLGGSIEKVEAE
jgi:hypothetical protein